MDLKLPPARPLIAVAAYLSAAAAWGAGATALPLKLALDPASTIWLQAAAWGVWLALSGGLAALTLARLPQIETAFLRDGLAGAEEDRDFPLRDHLTGLPGRALLRDRLAAAIAHARRANRMAALLFLDLDRFKSVNESHGQTVGDALLRVAARRVASCVRETDSIARLDGDAFAIIVGDLEGTEAVEALAARLHTALGRPFRIGDAEIEVTASIGISVFSGEDSDPDRLFNNAENALYRAKDSGRNVHHYFVTEMTQETQRRARLELDLRRAIGQGEIMLYYQPRVDLQTGRITGVEALARWKHEQYGWVSPGEFIPLAEECGLVLPLGEHVLRQACSQLKAWQVAGLPEISVAVNYSPSQFVNSDVVDSVTRALADTGLDGRFLEVELTESAVLRDPELVEAALQHLRAMGVRIALDDFGTGYSSLSHLKRLPLDMLKIDRSFVAGLDGGSNDDAIVGAVMALGRNLRLQVVAEGVESAEVARRLQSLGCTEAQGYYFSPPVAPDQLEPLLAAGILQPIPAAAFAAA